MLQADELDVTADSESKQFLSFSQAEQDARTHGCQILIADDTVLQFDLDNKEDIERFQNTFPTYIDKLMEEGETYIIQWTESKSGKRHVHVKLSGNGLPLAERLLIQACCGSDRKRELYSLIRHKALNRPGKEVLLFEKPDQADLVRWMYNKFVISAKVLEDYDVPF